MKTFEYHVEGRKHWDAPGCPREVFEVAEEWHYSIGNKIERVTKSVWYRTGFNQADEYVEDIWLLGGKAVYRRIRGDMADPLAQPGREGAFLREALYRKGELSWKEL